MGASIMCLRAELGPQRLLTTEVLLVDLSKHRVINTATHREMSAWLLPASLNLGTADDKNSGVVSQHLSSSPLWQVIAPEEEKEILLLAQALGMGVLRTDAELRSHQGQEAWKSLLNCFAIFSFVKLWCQERGLADEGAKPAFTLRLRLMGSAQQNLQMPKGDAWMLVCRVRYLPVALVWQLLRLLLSVREVPVDVWFLLF